jgi:hypothetical protein
MAAVEMKSILEANEIPADIIAATAGGALPQLSYDGGYKVMIDAHDWDKAVETEQANQPSERTR